jgi:hypothetical protein
MVGVLFALSFGSSGMIMMGNASEAEDTWGKTDLLWDEEKLV